MLSQSELQNLEDFLVFVESKVKISSTLSQRIQDPSGQQLVIDMAKKYDKFFQTISKHINSGQALFIKS